MYTDRKIWMAKSQLSGENLFLLPRMANRHGLIAGATGTGKTITMKVMAESFSDMGVPVFLADVKGDISGMCKPGKDSEDMQSRIAYFGAEGFAFKSFPTRFWDIFGEYGIPVRVTISEMGPTLLSRLLGLTDVQTGVLNIVFKVADEQGLLLLDLKDLRAMLQYVGENRVEFTTSYGNVSAASIGAIQRALLTFEDEGGEQFFGEPELDITNFLRTDEEGRGYINILESSRLIKSPTVYATFLLWMLSALYEKLPEVGDVEKPRMVFFFDEAHLLFTDTPRALLQKIVQIVKLIRSKGVGVYFVTQSPSDIPNEVLAQLSNKVQHALRAYTPSEMKAVKTAAKAFRVNPAFDTQEAIMELAVGEALVSFLDDDGIPTIVERARILPPQSLMGSAGEETVNNAVTSDEFYLKYKDAEDRESAYEIIQAATLELQRLKEEAEAELQRLKEEAEAEAQRLKEEAEAEKQRQKEAAAAEKAAAKEAAEAEKQAAREAAAAEKAAAKEAAEAEKQAAKEAAAAEKEALRKKNAAKNTAKKAATSAASSISSSLSTNIVNALTGGKITSSGTIAKRAARNALSSVMRTGSTALLRGLFGTKK